MGNGKGGGDVRRMRGASGMAGTRASLARCVILDSEVPRHRGRRCRRIFFGLRRNMSGHVGTLKKNNLSKKKG